LNRYLLDTNHLSAYLDRLPDLEARIDTGLRAGDRFGVCLPVLCEYRAGIRVSKRYRQNLVRLQTALGIFRLWPVDEQTTVEFAELFKELRSVGRMLSQFDLMIAAIARQNSVTLLTADQDFGVVSRLQIQNWL